MKKNSIIAFLLALLTVFFLSNFKIFQTLYLIPTILWVFPLFGFYFLSVLYFRKAFTENKKIIWKAGVILFGAVCIISLFKAGFSIWKINNGNIFLETDASFQINLKNVFFWIIYQSYLFLFFLSSFKQLVTIK